MRKTWKILFTAKSFNLAWVDLISTFRVASLLCLRIPRIFLSLPIRVPWSLFSILFLNSRYLKNLYYFVKEYRVDDPSNDFYDYISAGDASVRLIWLWNCSSISLIRFLLKKLTGFKFDSSPIILGKLTRHIFRFNPTLFVQGRPHHVRTDILGSSSFLDLKVLTERRRRAEQRRNLPRRRSRVCSHLIEYKYL